MSLFVRTLSAKKLPVLLSVLGVAASLLEQSLPALAQNPPPISWVARYRYTNNSVNQPAAVAADGVGNVYVTGYSYARNGGNPTQKYTTIKYDKDGNQLWIARHNESGGSLDWARDLAVDRSGNVYVTGSSRMASINYDYATVKYDPNGNELWAVRYRTPGITGDNDAYALAVDPSNNVYVTGFDANYGYATIKYDKDGNQLWVARYNGAFTQKLPNKIALDASGNVYVSGYATIKYDKDGNQLWVARHVGGNGILNFNARGLALDPSGNVYVAGGVSGDYVTVKYDAHGRQLWDARYNGTGNREDLARALVVDALGNAYVTGESQETSTRSAYVTVKYGTNGNPLWAASYGVWDQNRPYALALDGAGNVYVTGASGSTFLDNADYATIKYDAYGRQLWVDRYNAPSNYRDQAFSLALDGAGNVLVTGQSYALDPVVNSYDYATIKYGTASNPLPGVTGLGPSKVRADSGAFVLTVNGTGFVPGSTIHWNGTPRPTTYLAATRLSARIPAGDVSTMGTATVTVVSPGPGGGASNAATLTILRPLQRMPLLAPL